MAKANLAPEIKKSVPDVEDSILVLSTTLVSLFTLSSPTPSIQHSPINILLLAIGLLVVHSMEVNGVAIWLKP